MLLAAGTVPLKNLDVLAGRAVLVDGLIAVQGQALPVTRGTAALIAAMCVVCRHVGLEAPLSVISGDIGTGEGSARLYQYLKKAIPDAHPHVVALHYIMPNWYHHDEVFQAIRAMKRKPVLIADAGFMYAAKISGFAPEYDVFTPDLGELAFLADGEAPHPFYTRGFIFHKEDKVEDLIAMAYQDENAARHLLVKGKEDYICQQGKVLYRIGEPNVPALEAIGGTGDTITGIGAALVHKGLPVAEALRIAAAANRVAGRLADSTPATQIGEIIEKIPEALDEVMEKNI